MNQKESPTDKNQQGHKDNTKVKSDISFLDRHGYVKDIDHSLRLIDRKKR